MSRLRALVVDDSPTVRHRIAEVLGAQADFEVVGRAEDGKQAIELCLALRPDVITLDMAMPGMSGLSATEYIMAYCPTPILIVSSSTNRGELFKMYEALAAGAVDVLEKPDGAAADLDWELKLVGTLRLIARIKVITHLRARTGRAAAGSPPILAPRVPDGWTFRAIFMGASTGGPGAVREILMGLPPDFPLPIVLVLHIGKSFSSALADWLDTESPIKVAFATHGQALPGPEAGSARVLLAPPDRHLVLRGGRLWLEDTPELHSCRPSVDRLFASAAEELGHQAAGILLTGMGRDGAEGLLAMRGAGALTAAQDEATSVVYGMPREALAMGAVDRGLPLGEIASLVRGLAGGAE
jgi:two-component system chemotaxis response regulator CheB